METNELIWRLRHMRPGGDMCFGCGREHNCREEGCVIARAAADFIEAAVAWKIPEAHHA